MQTMSKRRVALILTLLFVAGPALRPSSLPQTQTLKGEVQNQDNQALVGAICTLRGRSLPEGGVTVTTGPKGGFEFHGLPPGTYALTCAADRYQPISKSGLEVGETAPPFVQVVLPPEIVVPQKIEVHEKAPSVTEQPTAPPATLTSQQLMTLPGVETKFQAALPLVPGVIRTPEGKLHIKGVAETQSLLLVDSAESVDPITGSFAIDLPTNAIESLEVHKSAYGAEYGYFSAGLVTIQTRPPSNKWGFEVQDLTPSPRVRSGQLVGIADYNPRLYFTGPLLSNKLNFSESAAYDVDKQPVRGLAWPHNEIKTQAVNSFTSFQYIFSPEHLLNANVHVFPLRRQFANINSLVPQSASSDYGQSGFSVAVKDRYLIGSAGALTSLVQVTDFDSHAHGQGSGNMLVTPNGWGGDFFNAYRRTSRVQEALEAFQFAPREWRGRHQLTAGADLFHRSYNGTSRSHPVLVLGADNTLAERIDFSGAGELAAQDTEAGLFLQDHWIPTDRLAVEFGLRYSGQTLGKPDDFGPRLGLVYAPGQTGRTILRGGFGVFFDHAPLLSGDFTQNPTRVVSFFDPQGLPEGPSLVFRNAYLGPDNTLTTSLDHLPSVPLNVTWNVEGDRELAPGITIRLGYLSSRTYDQFLINPLQLSAAGPALVMSSSGSSRYHEFESTVHVRRREGLELNASYLHSLSRGDLNTIGQVFVPFEGPVIRPGFFANLPADVPNRVVAWGRFQTHFWGIFANPVFDVHSGYPYSVVDRLQNYVGPPNSRRFPRFASLDLELGKDFHLPLPWLRSHKLRGALTILNVTNHANPRDVFNNITSPFFGHFVGFQHRAFDTALGILY
jgi:hypothetical protein